MATKILCPTCGAEKVRQDIDNYNKELPFWYCSQNMEHNTSVKRCEECDEPKVAKDGGYFGLYFECPNNEAHIEARVAKNRDAVKRNLEDGSLKNLSNVLTRRVPTAITELCPKCWAELALIDHPTNGFYYTCPNHKQEIGNDPPLSAGQALQIIKKWMDAVKGG